MQFENHVTQTLTLEVKQALVIELASLLHELWRDTRKRDDGSFEPRLKSTTDESWITANNTNEVDIANTLFADLPLDWQSENRAAAEVVMRELFGHIKTGGLLDASFIEQAAITVHNEWLSRNAAWAPPDQNQPFEQLSPQDQEKDRAQVRAAIKLYQSFIK